MLCVYKPMNRFKNINSTGCKVLCHCIKVRFSVYITFKEANQLHFHCISRPSPRNRIGAHRAKSTLVWTVQYNRKHCDQPSVVLSGFSCYLGLSILTTVMCAFFLLTMSRAGRLYTITHCSADVHSSQTSEAGQWVGMRTLIWRQYWFQHLRKYFDDARSLAGMRRLNLSVSHEKTSCF